MAATEDTSAPDSMLEGNLGTIHTRELSGQFTNYKAKESTNGCFSFAFFFSVLLVGCWACKLLLILPYSNDYLGTLGFYGNGGHRAFDALAITSDTALNLADVHEILREKRIYEQKEKNLIQIVSCTFLSQYDISSPSTPFTKMDHWWVCSAFIPAGRLFVSKGFAMLPKTERALLVSKKQKRMNIAHTKWSVDGYTLNARLSMSIVRHVVNACIKNTVDQRIKYICERSKETRQEVTGLTYLHTLGACWGGHIEGLKQSQCCIRNVLRGKSSSVQ